MSFKSDRDCEIISGETSGSVWSMARLPKKGESLCGDHFLVKKKKDKILVAVADGLGHGIKAKEASEQAISTLEHFDGETVINLVNDCHRNLRNTRGVVMSIGIIDCTEHTLTWLGIGNVEGVLLRSHKVLGMENIILRGGVIGYQLPSLKASLVPVSTGDTLVFTTDGVEREFVSKISIDDTPLETVKNIAGKCFKETDDALILALEYIEE